ncbi:hypothetical protein GGR57DRAFT_461242 [Xylariaceae sp. FL1272]|nr:hypothetical protein GGR57DRAFT_461242 [Xylariaceae sp. FL1272]
MATYDLGSMTGNKLYQYANSTGQIYYVDTVANTTSYSIPPGFEDGPNDTWSRDSSKPWPQWNNDRTGRATLMDPNPTAPQTYLDIPHVDVGLQLLARVPESEERLYQRPIGCILRFMFPESEGFDVVRDDDGSASAADFSITKACGQPGGTLYQYNFMLIESKRLGKPWCDIEDRLLNHLRGNDSKNCYGMIQIGLVVQFYKYEDDVCSKVGGRMHLITDANDIMRWGRHLKENPMSFV